MKNSTMNEHTGDAQRTKPPSDAYRKNWDVVFKKEPEESGSSLLCRADIQKLVALCKESAIKPAIVKTKKQAKIILL